MVDANKETLSSKISKLVDESIGQTSKWETNNVKWHKMRMRIKKEKTFPFVGCSNIRMPTIEIKLRKVKAALINTIFGIRPIVQVVPTPSGRWDTALKIEKFLDHMLMEVMKLKSKAIIAVDQMLEKGFFLLKPYWRVDIVTRIEKLDLNELPVEEALFLFEAPDEVVGKAIVQKYDVDMSNLVLKDNSLEIERIIKALRNGEEKLDATFQDVIYNSPDVALCEPERVYVPTDAGFNPQECDWIVHEFMLSMEVLKQNAMVKGWDSNAINEIIDNEARYKESTKSGAKRDKLIDTEKELREGITTLDETGKVKIWEFYGYLDINDDGVNEKCVVTIAPDFDVTFRKITLPFYSGKFPFTKLFYELGDDRWFSHRGIPELIEDVVKEIDMQHNQKLDQQTIRNSPMYVYRAGMINKNTVQFVFGQGIPAHGMQPLQDLIAPLNNNNPNVEFSYEKEQMLLESKVEELIGQIDFTLQSMINKRQPRTLGEVQLQQQNMQMVFSLDSDMARMNFEDLFNWVWELWCQYGSDEYEFAYFGKDGWEKIRLTKEETQGKYKVTVRGNDQNTNPQARLQKAQTIIAMQQNQLAVQMGVVTPMNVANAYKRAYQELDIPNWEELITMPVPQPPVPQVKIGMQDLTDAEAMQVLAKQGIQPDPQGRGLKSQAIIQEKQSEQKSKVINDMKGVFDSLIKREQVEESNAEEEEAPEAPSE